MIQFQKQYEIYYLGHRFERGFESYYYYIQFLLQTITKLLNKFTENWEKGRKITCINEQPDKYIFL